ncbi:hypothetical protein J6590_085443 [Homalodisca vitripennis]|nr:hypothetical protein J6590_085443 [Homalodisca vitripennis]
MFVNDLTLQFSQITVDNISTYEHITGELSIVGSKEHYKFIIHAVYRPPTSSSGFSLPQATEELTYALTKLHTLENLILIGDTNINLKNKSDINVLSYEAALAERGLERGIWD